MKTISLTGTKEVYESLKQRDPKTSVDSIDEMARRVLNGDIVLPKFQRGMVWKKRQVIDLLDSIARGYPIGSFLLWQSAETQLNSDRSIAELDTELANPGYPVNYLLDGQQRLSAICGALYWQGTDNPKSQWNVAYDLRKQIFFHSTTLDELPIHQIRVNKLSNSFHYARHIDKTIANSIEDDKELLMTRAEALMNRFNSYKIPTITLDKDMRIEDIAPIFERINSTGTRLTIVDLMRAATWSPEFDLLDTIRDILDTTRTKGFHTTDELVILRNISAASGGRFHSSSITNLRILTSTELTSSANQVKQAYKRAVDFLSGQLKIPNAKIVPYANQMTILTEIFRRLPSPTVLQYQAIRDWFWRSALSEYFSGWNTGAMATDFDAIKEFASSKTMYELNIRFSKPDKEIWEDRTFRSTNAHSKLLAILLSYHAPIDLLTGQIVSLQKALSWSNTREFHHFFPRKYLQQQNIKLAKINALANRIMLTSISNKKIQTKAPSEYLWWVVENAGDNLERWLSSNLITMEAFEAALEDDFEKFLDLRAITIHNRIMELAGWKK